MTLVYLKTELIKENVMELRSYLFVLSLVLTKQAIASVEEVEIDPLLTNAAYSRVGVFLPNKNCLACDKLGGTFSLVNPIDINCSEASYYPSNPYLNRVTRGQDAFVPENSETEEQVNGTLYIALYNEDNDSAVTYTKFKVFEYYKNKLKGKAKLFLGWEQKQYAHTEGPDLNVTVKISSVE